jgi:orotidine-5'-phosphate decarboxylase
MRRLSVLIATLAWPWAVWAHPGHGNSVLHALMHLLEDHGAWLGLVLVAIVAVLGHRMVQAQSLRKPMSSKRQRHDSR